MHKLGNWELASVMVPFLTECRYTKPATSGRSRVNKLSITLDLTYRHQLER